MAKGFRIIVTGQYYAGAGREKVLKVYKSETFYIPETVEIVNGRDIVMKDLPNGKKVKTTVPRKQTVSGAKAASHVIQRRYLAARLTDKYPDYAGFRTCQIVDIQPVAEIPAGELVDLSKPVNQMNLYELNVLCATESLVSKPSMFADLQDARLAIIAERKENGVKEPSARAQTLVNNDDADAKAGIKVASGPVTSEDGVPIDEEDPMESLL